MAKLSTFSFLGSAAILFCALFNPASAQSNQPDLSKLQAALGGRTPDSIAETPVPGMYEVLLGSQILYLSEDGRYAMQGDVIDLEAGNNLTENRRNDLRADALKKVSESDMIVFPAAGDAKYQVSVFTDIDCGYCRKLHSEISAYNAKGITVRYMAFPRAGIDSESYRKAVSAWCADNPQEALTAAKLGEEIEEKTCPNPVASQYQLGQQMGVRGTPSIVLDNGEMVPGYMPAERLEQTLANLATQ